MPNPILIPKADADKNTPAFQQALKRANELGVDLIHVTPQMAVVPHHLRRDPQAYQEARRFAQVLGTQVSFADPDGDANHQPPAFKTTYLDTEDAVFVLSGKLEPREYQRVTQKARAELRRVVPLRSWDDAPDAVREALKATDAA